jgi:hypothetical protein
MKKNVGISISKCLKSAAKNRRANQTARAILTAPTVHMDVMYNMNMCYASIIIRYSLYIGEKYSEGKDVGEI